MTFGEKLRLFRNQKGFTQAELAKKAGLGINTIANYEAGKTYPQNRNVYRILADILDVDVDSLRNENEEFVTRAKEEYGQRGATQAEKLIENAHALFAGGSLSDADKEKLMLALQEAYWTCKRDNVEKYGRKNSGADSGENF